MTDHFNLPPERPSQLAWWLHPKIALPLMLLTLLVLAPFLYRGYRIASVPDIGDPFDVEAFGTVDIAPADNAMTHYAVAVGLSVDAGFRSVPVDDVTKAIEFGWEQTCEPIRRHLAANEPALTEWRKGTERTQAIVVQPKDFRIDMPLELIEKLRNFARAALFKADQCLFAGDVESAWGWHRAAIRCSRHVAQNGGIFQAVVGSSNFQLATPGIARWAEDSRVSAEQLQRAIDDCRAADDLATSNSDALKCEYLALIESLHWKHLKNELGMSSSMSPVFSSAIFLLGEPEFSERLFQHAFDNWLSEIDKPRWQQAPQLPGHFGLFELPAGKRPSLPARELEARLKSQCLAKYLLRALAPSNEALQRMAVRQTALKLMLACQLYHRLHGDWPTRLEELTPAILSELPADPLGKAGESFRMKRDADELLIYSVGSNGIDDGGTVKHNDNPPPDEGFRLRRPK